MDSACEELVKLRQENEHLRRQRDAWLRAMGDIAAAIPLPDILKATGSVQDMIDYLKTALKEPTP